MKKRLRDIAGFLAALAVFVVVPIMIWLAVYATEHL